MWTFRSNWSSTALLLVATAILAHTQQLAVEDAVITDFEGGIGVPLTYQFSSGQKAHLAFRIRGFSRGETEQKISLNYTIDVFDCDGVLIAPPHSGAVERRSGSVSRSWIPTVRYVVDIPAVPRAGTHMFRIRVRDNVAAIETLTGIEFEVQSAYDEPAESFELRRFRFYGSERDEKPVAEPVFRAGDSMWGRFLLTGFRTEAGNRYDLRYGVSLRNAAGRTLFSEPNAASETRESFYPKSHVSGAIKLALERAIRPGQYALVISALDALGKQLINAEFPFRVVE
ncbi:MAG TPA: hypothetical protein VEX68_13470 [Bryobacteraceae bacterium]|nr:hypothetical protein [Bryobacteraceae bacterium]